MLWIGLRAGFFGCFPLLVTMLSSGSTQRWGMLLVPLFCLITALGFAGFGIAVAGSVAKIDQFNYVTTLRDHADVPGRRHLLPDRRAAEWAQVAAQFNPLYQLVELVRHACFGFEATDLLRLAGLLAVLARRLAAGGSGG